MMRLRKIKIINFGQLSNLSFTLPSRKLNVFFGANEAGKSTTVAFIKQVMFGFYLRSTSSPFFEDYKPLAHVSPMGGSLFFVDDNGASFELERLWAKGDKTKRGILTVKKDGQVVPASLFFDQIQNIDGNFYTASFIFNQEMLNQVASLSQKDLLERIYYLGAANSSQLLLLRDDFAKKADNLFKKTGRKPLVNQLLQEMADKQAAYQKTQGQFADYEELSQTLTKQEKELAASQTKLNNLQVEKNKLDQAQQQLANFTKLQALQKQVHPVHFDQANYQKARSLQARMQNLQENLATQEKQITPLADQHFDWEKAHKLVQKKAEVLAWQSQTKDNQEKIKELTEQQQAALSAHYALSEILNWPQARVAACQQDYEKLPQVEEKESNNYNLFLLLGAVLAVAGLVMIGRGIASWLLLIAGLALLAWGLRQKQLENKSRQKVQQAYAAFEQKYGFNARKIEFSALLSQLKQYQLLQQSIKTRQENLQVLQKQLNGLTAALSRALDKPLKTSYAEVLAGLDQVDTLAQEARHKYERVQDLQANIKANQEQLTKFRLELKAILAQDNVSDPAAYEKRYQASLDQTKLATQISALKTSLGDQLPNLQKLAKQPEKIKLDQARIEQEIKQAKQIVRQEQNEIAQSEVKLQDLADSQAVITAKQDLANSQTRLTQASRDYLADLLAAQWLNRTLDIASNERFPKMLKAACAYLRLLTGGRYTALELGQRLNVTRADGKKRAVKYLSRGTAEQLYFALKLAFIAQIRDQINLPILIDDSFVNFDDRRVSYIKELLQKISGNNQVLIFTAQKGLVDKLGVNPLVFRKEASHAEETAWL